MRALLILLLLASCDGLDYKSDKSSTNIQCGNIDVGIEQDIQLEQHGSELRMMRDGDIIVQIDPCEPVSSKPDNDTVIVPSANDAAGLL